jgi:hypothetical protein
LDHRKSPLYKGSITLSVQGRHEYPETSQLILQANQVEDQAVAVASVQSWLADPAQAKLVLEASGLTADGLSLSELSKLFRPVVTVEGGTSFQVEYANGSRASVEKVLTALRAQVERTAEVYNGKGGQLTILIDYSAITVTDRKDGLPLAPIAGLLIGALFAVVVAAVVDDSSRRS